MAKEENKAGEQPKPLTREQLAAYVNNLEIRLKDAYQNLREAEKQINLYQMQDYYQRAQLLCVVLANDKLNEEFRKKCEEELQNLVYPPKKEMEPEK